MGLKSGFMEGVRTSINRHSLKRSEWICKNFTHPRDSRIPWSFKDHEFQIDIVDSKKRDVAIKKCAQVGLSELSIRDVLAFCAMMDYLKIAYVLPTAKFSSEFSSTRFDPAIDSCSYISNMMSKEIDNTGVKKIGTCFLIMRGTSGATAAISVDLDAILTDEIDFCNQEVLGKFASRLLHSELKITKNFSTPTVPDFGISKFYQESSQGNYLVKHSRCGKWVSPEFYNDLVIPGFKESIADFTKEDADFPGINKAYLKCPACSRKIQWTDFLDADRRTWVHSYPDRDREGFHVKPWDVPKYNSISEVLSSISTYNLHSDWVNFRLGLDTLSADDSFLEAVIDRNSVTPVTALASLMANGVFIGADLGKISHIVVGVACATGLEIICAETVKVQDLPGANLGIFLLTLFRRLRAVKIIVDAAPNYETAMYLAGYLPYQQAYGAYYSGAKTTSLDIYNFKDNDGIVHIDRDASFDDLAKAVNAGRIRFPALCMLLKQHLLAMKKIRGGSWTNTGPDHYAHALNLCYTAYSSVENRIVGRRVHAGVELGKVKLKGLDNVSKF